MIKKKRESCEGKVWSRERSAKLTTGDPYLDHQLLSLISLRSCPPHVLTP